MSVLLSVLLTGCRQVEDTRVPEWSKNVAAAEVREIVPAGDRRLLHVVESQWDFWASVPAEPPLAVGDHVWLGKGRELAVEGRKAIVIEQVAKATPAQLAAFETLPPPEGGLAIGELFAQRTALAGKSVKVRGRIVKVSYDVFETNWYHLQDGTGAAADATHDLTVTTTEKFTAGQVVVATGDLSVDKDLGFGYFYPAILENGTLVADP